MTASQTPLPIDLARCFLKPDFGFAALHWLSCGHELSLNVSLPSAHFKCWLLTLSTWKISCFCYHDRPCCEKLTLTIRLQRFPLSELSLHRQYAGWTLFLIQTTCFIAVSKSKNSFGGSCNLCCTGCRPICCICHAFLPELFRFKRLMQYGRRSSLQPRAQQWLNKELESKQV